MRPCTAAVRGASTQSGPLVVSRGTTAVQPIDHRGVLISPPLTALQEISAKLSWTDLVVAFDALAADRFGAHERITRAQLAEQLAAARGKGTTALRRALPYVRECSWSPMETRMRLLLIVRGFPEPALNVQVDEDATGIAFYIDLAYPEERVAIEYDSEHHRNDRAAWQHDLNKNEVLHDAGWAVVRASAADYRSPRQFLARVETALAKAGRRAATVT